MSLIFIILGLILSVIFKICIFAQLFWILAVSVKSHSSLVVHLFMIILNYLVDGNTVYGFAFGLASYKYPRAHVIPCLTQQKKVFIMHTMYTRTFLKPIEQYIGIIKITIHEYNLARDKLSTRQWIKETPVCARMSFVLFNYKFRCETKNNESLNWLPTRVTGVINLFN